MANHIYCPLEVLTDTAITDAERRVLFALFSFRGKDTNTVFPSREALAVRCHIRDLTHITKLTGSLAEKGWLTKRKKSFRRGNEYCLTIPDRLLYCVSRETEDSPNLGDSPKLGTSESSVSEGENSPPNLDDKANVGDSPNMGATHPPNLGESPKPKEQTTEQTNTHCTTGDIGVQPNLGKSPNKGEDWKPPDDLVTQLTQLGMPREFILDPVALLEFKIYWGDRPEPVSRWPAKFVANARHRWVNHQTERERAARRGDQRDAVSAALDDIDNTDWADEVEAADG